jgi:hypothetical protein
MKLLVILAFFSLSSLWASVSQEEIVCFTDMSDGACSLTEDQGKFHARCLIDVVIELKTGERTKVIYEGEGKIKKNEFALLMNSTVSDRALAIANENLYKKITPFFTLKSCE